MIIKKKKINKIIDHLKVYDTQINDIIDVRFDQLKFQNYINRLNDYKFRLKKNRTITCFEMNT